MRISHGLILSVSLAVFFYSSAGLSAQKLLSAHQIQALFPGIYEGIADDKHKFIVSVGTNGQLIGRAQGIEKKLPWKISGQKLCITLSEDKETKTFCSRIALENGWYKAIKNDGSSHVKFKPYKKQ